MPSGGQSYKRPVSVLVVVYTRGRQLFLMLERTRPRGFWQSVTGSLRWGERPRAAALRELREETGLDGRFGLVSLRRVVRFPIIHPWRARYAPGARLNREHWFELRLATRRPIRLSEGEHGRYRWLSGKKAAALASSWTNAAAVRRLGGGR